ncbi:hypothetical protein C8R43DRAFT_899567 [Mycena crocata]|nr:hypothetical protein C8R43DRAFT_899567 [Mycena crocata]
MILALNSANEAADIIAAANAAVKAAEASAAKAAAAAAAVSHVHHRFLLLSSLLGNWQAIANNPAAMASAMGSGVAAQNIAQSTIAAFTDIFGDGTIPDSINSIIEQVSNVISQTAAALIDTWDTKPPQTDRVPPDVDPSRSPTVNSAGGDDVAPAACLGAGSKGQLTINGPFTWLATGTNKQPATMVDAGNPAYFGLSTPSGDFHLGALCSGVYGWYTGATEPNHQTSCSTHETGSYWNDVKQACYIFPLTSTSFGAVCANDIGKIYSCLQSNGLHSELTPVSFSWST